MDLDELNKQMFVLQNEFKQQTQQLPQNKQINVNSINFQEVQSPIETTQIKRPTKSGEHRNDINDKLNSMNTFQYLPQDLSQNPPNTMPEFTRNYSNAPQVQSQVQVQSQEQVLEEINNIQNKTI